MIAIDAFVCNVAGKNVWGLKMRGWNFLLDDIVETMAPVRLKAALVFDEDGRQWDTQLVVRMRNMHEDAWSSRTGLVVDRTIVRRRSSVLTVGVARSELLQRTGRERIHDWK